VLAPIVEAATAETRREGEGFGCPLLLAAIDRAGPSQSLAMAGLLLADHAFPRGSWPWTLAREAARIAAGHGEYTGAVLIQMYSDSEIGPITCAAFAAALLRAQKSKLAAPFAQRGLADLSTRAFLLDMRPFHVGDSVSARIVRRVCETLRGLTADEIDALVSLFPATDRPAAREVVKRLAAAEESDSRAIPDALRILWEKGLRTRVEGALNGLLRQATAPID